VPAFTSPTPAEVEVERLQRCRARVPLGHVRLMHGRSKAKHRHSTKLKLSRDGEAAEARWRERKSCKGK
jgi:hypothetical protein